jgi:hypothetical protein
MSTCRGKGFPLEMVARIKKGGAYSLMSSISVMSQGIVSVSCRSLIDTWAPLQAFFLGQFRLVYESLGWCNSKHAEVDFVAVDVPIGRRHPNFNGCCCTAV